MSLTLRDIERFIAYSEVMTHLANLKQIEQSVEGHLAIAVDIDAAAIRRSWLDDIPEEEGGLAIADAAVATLREQSYPRLFRGGFLVTLYATFEECLRQMGDAAVRFSDKDDVPPFERRVNKSLLDAACDHFFGKLGYERWPTALEDDLKALGDVRNCFAHSAGKATGRWRRRIDAWNDAVGTLAFTEDDYIIPSQRFMRESRVNVTVAVEHVLQQTPAGMAR